MRNKRLRSMGRVIAGLLTVGVLFQGAQCDLTSDEITTLLIQDVGSLLITSFVNDQLGAQQGFGGF